MARIVTYTILLVGLLTLMDLAGISTVSTSILNALGYADLAGFAASTLFTTAAAIFALAALGGVIIGTLTRQSVESYMVAGMASLLIYFVADIMGLYFTMKAVCDTASTCSWAANLVLLIALPFAAAYIISMVQWWRGNDI